MQRALEVMRARAGRKLLLPALVLLPSLAVLLYGLDLPHLGFYRDDGIYLATAESLARGQGYRIASLPGTPWNVKYPPLYPALLTPAFWLGRSLPAVLAIANILNWLALPLFAFLSYRLFRRSRAPAAAVLLLFCLSFPGLVACSHSLLSDLWAAVAVLAALAALERSPVAAGLLTAAAILIRTSSAAVLAAVTAELLLARRYRQAVLYAVIAAAPAALWMLVAAPHRPPLADFNDYYMSTYMDNLAYELRPRQIPAHVARQSVLLLAQYGRVFIHPLLWAGAPLWLLAACGAAALACLGALPRLYRMFVAFWSLVLIAWHGDPVPRFLLPAVPLLAAAAALRLAGLARRWRIPLPAWAVAVPCALFLLGEEFQQAYLVHHYRERLARLQPVYDWIRVHTPPEAAFSAYLDARLYFSTGRRADAVQCSIREEREKPGSSVRRILSLVEWSRKRGHRYVLVAPDDYLLPEKEWHELESRVRRNAAVVLETDGVLLADLSLPPLRPGSAAARQ